MEKLFNWISIVFGVIGGGITYWLGGWDLSLKTTCKEKDFTGGVLWGREKEWAGRLFLMM